MTMILYKKLLSKFHLPEAIFYKQTPVLYKTGVANPKFEAQKPFTI